MSHSSLSGDQARSELYDIMSQDLPFEEKANKALELGEAYLGVKNGHLTKIDERIDFWEAIASTDPPEGDFPAETVLDLQTTYCRRTIQEGSSIALHDAPNEGWADDPAYQEHGLHCYHGTPLSVDNEVFGTICFVSEEAKEEPFSESETMFAELIARMLENELRHTRQAADLNLQSNLISVLSRVLRHNLRNDLNVIRGQLSMMAERSDEPLEYNESALGKIDKLVDLANTARQIESIASADYDEQPVELTTLVEHVIDRARTNHSETTFTIEGPEEIYAEAIPTLRVALEELIGNAAKHAGDDAEVTIKFEGSPDNIDIQIIDNGPGLPEQERDVLRQGSESPLIHGSGLGLWLTYWIVANHEGSINADVSEAGTSITVTLPRTSGLSEFADSETLLGQFHRKQDRFEAIFDESFDAIVLSDDEGRYIDVNESAADLFGLPQEELRGRSIADFVPGDFDFEAAWSAFLESERERDTFQIERADGEVRTVEYSAVADIIPGEHLSILRDVTDRIEREQELQETTQQLQAIVEASPDPLVALDTDATVQLWNEAAEDVFGYQTDEVLGKSIQSLDLHDEAQYEDFEDRFKRALNGEVFTDLEIRRRMKDGEDCHLSLSTAPLRDDMGEIEGIMVVARDITERKQEQQELERLRELYEEAERIGDLGAWEVSEDGEIRWTSGTRRIHDVEEDYDPTIDEAIEYYHPEDRDAIRRAVRDVLESGKPYALEARLITEDGNQRWIRTHGEPVSDEEPPTTVRGYLLDITDQKDDPEVASIPDP